MKTHAREIFEAGVRAAVPDEAIRRWCRLEDGVFHAGDQQYDLREIEKILVVGAGKATAVMAGTIEAILGPHIHGGCISVKYGHTVPLERIRQMEAGHPVPDEKGCRAAEAILQVARTAKEKDLVICLISGGGSALLPLPVPGVTLEDKQAVTRLLLASGADIHQINTIRKQLSAIKGGKLARAASPAQLLCLVLSDVVGDDPAVIASGPCTPDDASPSDAWDIIAGLGLEAELPAQVQAFFQTRLSESNDKKRSGAEPSIEQINTLMVGNNRQALAACEQQARMLGYTPFVLSAFIEGETHTIARVHAAIARQIKEEGQPAAPPVCILSGGESTLQLTGKGKGGRNQQAALAAAKDLDGLANVAFLCGGTDGTDGPTDAAGAVVDGNTCKRALQMGMSWSAHLRNNNAYPFFDALQDLVITGPTGTNVMDLNILLVGHPEEET